MAYERVKRHYLIDAVVVIIILIVVSVFVGISGSTVSGWDIKDSEEILVDQDKVVESDVHIREGGILTMTNSSLSILSSYRNQYGLRVSGDSALTLNESKITCNDFPCYIISYADEEGKSPRIEVTDSSLENHSGILLSNRTRFSSENSSVGELHLKNDAMAELKSSFVIPVLYSGEEEEYTGLAGGDSVSMTVTSLTGWELSLDSCEVPWYRIELLEGDGVKVVDSLDIVLGIHSPGNLKSTTAFDLGFMAGKSSGSFDDVWFDFDWSDSRIDRVLFFLTGEDDVTVTDGVLGDVEVADSASIAITGSELRGSRYLVSGNSEAVFASVTAFGAEDTQLGLVLSGGAVVSIKDSDLIGMVFQVTGDSILNIDSSEYDPEMIEIQDNGSVIIDGEEFQGSN